MCVGDDDNLRFLFQIDGLMDGGEGQNVQQKTGQEGVNPSKSTPTGFRSCCSKEG